MDFEEFMVIMRVYSRVMGYKNLYSLLLGKQTIHEYLDKVEKLETENLKKLTEGLDETVETISNLSNRDEPLTGAYQAVKDIKEFRRKDMKERIAIIRKCRRELKGVK